MKKFIAFAVCLSTLLFSSCAQKDLIDIYTFSQRFSRHSQSFAIDADTLSAKEDGDTLKFPLVFGDKLLLTVNADSETFLITSFSVTYMFDEEEKISDKDFASFIEISRCATAAFTDSENETEVFEELSLKTKSDVLKRNHLSCEKGFYKYSFVSDEIGFYFAVATDRR